MASISSVCPNGGYDSSAILDSCGIDGFGPFRVEIQPSKMIEISGKHLEGGGQVVRLAVGLAALTGTPIHISEIRGNRPRGGGLKTQHLRAVSWLGDVSNALMTGAEKGSRDLVFRPGVIEESIATTPRTSPQPDAEKLRVQNIKIDIGSPGSIGLVLQAILPYILFSAKSADPLPVKLTISGGTNVSFSPSYDYICHVLIPTLSQIGLPPISVGLNKRGWSHGGSSIGSLWFSMQPLSANTTFPAFTLMDRGKIDKFSAVLLAPDSAIRRQLEDKMITHLNQVFPGTEVEVTANSDSGSPKRFYLLIVAHSSNGFRLGRDWLYDLKIKDFDETVDRLVEKVVREMELEVSHGGCVDEYMQDQLVIFQSLAQGKSMVNRGQHRIIAGQDSSDIPAIVTQEPSLHTKTARWVAETILGIKFDEYGNCEGRGLAAGHSKSDLTKIKDDNDN